MNRTKKVDHLMEVAGHQKKETKITIVYTDENGDSVAANEDGKYVPYEHHPGARVIHIPYIPIENE